MAGKPAPDAVAEALELLEYIGDYAPNEAHEVGGMMVNLQQRPRYAAEDARAANEAKDKALKLGDKLASAYEMDAKDADGDLSSYGKRLLAAYRSARGGAR